MFAVIPRLKPNVHMPASVFAPTWNFTYKYSGTSYTEEFIGTNPSAPASTTVAVYLIPIKLVYGTTTEDPLATVSGGTTNVIQQVAASPLFQYYNFKFGSTAIGLTQYEDAFAKVSVWKTGGSSTDYHVLLAQPKVTAEQTITVPKAQGGLQTDFGVPVIVANINYLDPKFQALITTLKIPSNALPIFITTQTYLLGSTNKSDCCIGGYHSVDASGQPYAHATYITKSGAFSQDVSALSHELGEWVADPYTDNNSPCGIYEVGDPLEGDANYGDYPYALGGFTYHLQDLALPPYFGAPKGITLKNLKTLKGTSLAVCANGS